MTACEKQKYDLQKEEVPISVWKKIKDELEANGVSKDWQVIRAKFENMKQYFSRSLESGGMVAGIMWQHYKSFCDIYDIDCDIEETPLTEPELSMFNFFLTCHHFFM